MYCADGFAMTARARSARRDRRTAGANCPLAPFHSFV
jgi:hypothetical protein